MAKSTTNRKTQQFGYEQHKSSITQLVTRMSYNLRKDTSRSKTVDISLSKEKGTNK